MVNCITTTVSVHITGRSATIECRDLQLAGNKTCPMLIVADLTVYPDRAQLEAIRDAVSAYLTDTEVVPFDDARWDADEGLWTATDATDADVPGSDRLEGDVPSNWTATDATDGDFPDPTPDEHWKGRTDAATLLAPICGGSVDEVPPEYHPTDADWASYREWCESVDAIDAINECRASEVPA